MLKTVLGKPKDMWLILINWGNVYSMRDVYIIGCKGIPAKYGGYETFVDNLVRRQKSNGIKYHVACLNRPEAEGSYFGAECFSVRVPNIGPAKAVLYDLRALKACIRFIEKSKTEKPIVYVLTCRIGPFFKRLVRKIHRLGGTVMLNPDGHEWLRAKWPKPVRWYWKRSERSMVRWSDLIICDSRNIQKYIDTEYSRFQPKTCFVPYGADICPSSVKDDDAVYLEWQKKWNVTPGSYYVSVGRFVPENNFEIMIREFMASKTKKDFVIITNVEQNKLYRSLEKKYRFTRDPRIKFVGTIYNPELLKKIREDSFAYIHGHSVGGTNPSLLEALASTKVNILYDVGFNKECGAESSLYFTSEIGSLAQIIDDADTLSDERIAELQTLAKDRIKADYSWAKIVSDYEELFR